jgi:uncharacterized RDD family membrane protein YckC
MDVMSRPPLAGIGARFGAILLDGLLPSLIMLPLAITAYIMILPLVGTSPSVPGETMLTVGAVVLALTILGYNCYSALVMAMWAYGLTPGKWIVGLQVVRMDSGRPVGFWRMFLREYIGRFVASLLCAIGYIWALFDANKQGWHDKIAKTLVVRTK